MKTCLADTLAVASLIGETFLSLAAVPAILLYVIVSTQMGNPALDEER